MKTWVDCTHKEQIERWTNVLRVLTKMTRHAREKHFDMSNWAEKTDCGTVGCAAGHCAMDPWFRRRGFKGEFRPYQYTDLPGFYWRFTGIEPEEFFGSDGHHRIFVNTELCNPEDEDESRGASAHRAVVAEVREYIKELKASL
jgi:hypothetical protein